MSTIVDTLHSLAVESANGATDLGDLNTLAYWSLMDASVLARCGDRDGAAFVARAAYAVNAARRLELAETRYDARRVTR